MNILVLGSGGREHAIAWSLSQSPLCDQLYVAPGNGGTALFASNIDSFDINNGEEVLDFVKQSAIELVVIGPEAPLVSGVADVLRASQIKVFGPDAQGAKLEGSKSFCKEFMMRNNLPTADYISTSDPCEARTYVKKMGAPIVVKADGLAAGKGVVVASTEEEALNAIDECFEGKFGKAGKCVVIEECLEGPECSMLAFVSKGKSYCMAPSQDHKRAYDGDKGPNTGGMGAYSPVPIVEQSDLEIMEDIMERAAKATAREFENDYRGVLYGGFIITKNGPKLLEYNARFGDPETQVVLPRLKSDLVEVMLAVAEGQLENVSLDWHDKWAITVVLASEGYPRAYETGKPITGIEDAEQIENVKVFHAGTCVDENGILKTAGGRVLNVTAMGNTFKEAQEKAYQACNLIKFEGKQMRTDIGNRAL